jgi:predicted permease
MKLFRRVRYFLLQRQMERELREEIEFHRAQGRSAREMGNVTRALEDARAVWIAPWLQSIWQDVSYAVRGLRREASLTAMILLALGTAIGLNTSLFTVFNAVALRSWPVKDPSRIVRIFTKNGRPTNGNYGLTGLSIAEFRYLADHTRSFAALASLSQRRVRFGFERFGKGSTAILVAADHFRAIGSDLHIGRGFLSEEDRLLAPEAVMVISYDVWRNHFGSDPAILGKRLPVNNVPFTVVGVASENFNLHGEHEDVWIPLPSVQLLFPNDASQRDWLSNPNSCCEPMAGRLADGITREQARAELEVLSDQFHSVLNGSRGATFVLTDPKILAGDPEASGINRIFGTMFFGVTLIVLLACANVGNLLVARAAARQREIEIRRAIGAGRVRIIRQLMTESLLLAFSAAAIGVLIAFRLPAIVLNLMFENDAPSLLLRPDATVMAYVTGLAMLACLCFGLAPALHGSHPRPLRSRFRLRSWLLTSQVALSVILLTGAGLMLEGVQRASHRDPGFLVDHVAVTSFELPASELSRTGISAFASALQQNLPAIPAMESFGLAMRAPMEGSWNTVYRLPQETRDQLKRIDYQEVAPGYFSTLGIPILAGRDFEPQDAGHPVIVVNETVARHWPDGAIGRTLFVAGTPRQIIGVAKNTHTAELDEIGPALYQPLTGMDIPKVLSRAQNIATTAAIEALAGRIVPGTRAQTLSLSAYLDRRIAPSRAAAEIAGLLGLFALGLATVGMFGVFAYAVQQRTKEIGIRRALGARAFEVVRYVIFGTSRALACGLAAGAAMAAVVARLLAEYLHGVSPLDPTAYLWSTLILAVAALAASYLPSRRASRIDPSIALRHE